MVMLIMSFSNVAKKKERKKLIFLFLYDYIHCLRSMSWFTFLCVCVCVCVCVWFLCTFQYRTPKNILFLACMLCFPKSGNLPFDVSLIMHTYARECTCTDDICKKQFSGMPSRALNWEKHRIYKLKKVHSYMLPLILVK